MMITMVAMATMSSTVLEVTIAQVTILVFMTVMVYIYICMYGILPTIVTVVTTIKLTKKGSSHKRVVPAVGVGGNLPRKSSNASEVWN